jgi:hypothetical protein
VILALSTVSSVIFRRSRTNACADMLCAYF